MAVDGAEPARLTGEMAHRGRVRIVGQWARSVLSIPARESRGRFMTERTAYPEDDPRHHTAHLREMLQGLVSHAREDITKISEPKAQALFETTAEVCTGLINAFDDYDRKEPASR
jgi:hypothetical protein